MVIRDNLLKQGIELSKKYPSYKNFLRGITSDHTKSDYIYSLTKFMILHNLTDYGELAKLGPKEVDVLIIDFLDHLVEHKIKASTQRGNLVGIERFFIMNDVIFHKDKIRKGINKDVDMPGGKIPVTTEELYNMLKSTKSLRSKTIIHLLATTGMRPAGLSDPILRMKHLVELHTSFGIKCYAVTIYDGSIEGYWAFFTPEAASVLDQYIESRKIKGEEFTSETPILGKERKRGTDGMRTDHARHIIYNLIKETGIERTKVSRHRYDKSVMYMFRKRFNTILKINNDVNSNIAEKLMAHKKGLDGTYLQPTREECFTEFVKAIYELTIDPTNRQKVELLKKQEKIDELIQKTQENNDLKGRLEMIEIELQIKEKYPI